MSLDGDRMAALRHRFVAAASDDAERIEALLAVGDLEGVRSVAHGVAGRAGLFGFAELGAVAKHADEAATAVLPEHARDLVTALRQLARGS